MAASGTTAPLASITVPVIVAAVDACAWQRKAVKTMTKAQHRLIPRALIKERRNIEVLLPAMPSE